MLKALATSIIRTLRQRGFQAYLVGGCVRDLLLNREPADYDVATSATPPQVMEIFPDTYAVGVQFGVVLVPLPEEQRSVILLVGLEGMDYAEAAAFVNAPVGTVRSRIARGRESLRKETGLFPARHSHRKDFPPVRAQA